MLLVKAHPKQYMGHTYSNAESEYWLMGGKDSNGHIVTLLWEWASPFVHQRLPLGSSTRLFWSLNPLPGTSFQGGGAQSIEESGGLFEGLLIGRLRCWGLSTGYRVWGETPLHPTASSQTSRPADMRRRSRWLVTSHLLLLSKSLAGVGGRGAQSDSEEGGNEKV